MYIQPAPVLHIWWFFHPSGLTHFCMFVIHQHDLVLQGYCFSVDQAWPTSACLWYIGLIWFYKATLCSSWPGLTHFCMFIIHWPDLGLQDYIIFPIIRPDPLLHVYDTSAWAGFTRLHYVPLDPAWPTFACLWYIGLIWFYKATFVEVAYAPDAMCRSSVHYMQ